MRPYVRLAVNSRNAPEAVDSATNVLRRRLAELADQGGTWECVRTVPRPGAPDALGPVSDLLVEFVVDDELTPSAALAASSYLVRAVIGHFRAQPDRSQSVTVTAGDESVELRAEGVAPEEAGRLEALIAERLTRPGASRE
ncbi:effector-associated constant component EACC1 [Streptomyces sp. NPDC054796]